MPDDEEWAFENEIELWDDDESPPPVEDEPERDGPAGRDGDSVVTVTVSPAGEVQRVRLAEDWKTKVDPRGLHSSVLTAANAATIEALARRARDVEANPASRPPAAQDETPLTARDVFRLEDAVRGEANWNSFRLGCPRPASTSSPRKAAAAM
ncbi:YbaB/EbfC family nucleoid-associated protein [Amycolatopsis solani]|uniref:YbaB/EbfC family nucleoid-associated protein n=1 Tax=Amycolatopsis solani TaxID=3028615 RepID=UPI0025AFD128|nr:YbaB/EbfC family nucleoid-associated protein [Amycolatopsis sp. MEP2-6]